MRQRDPHKELKVRLKAIDLIVSKGLDHFSMQKLAKAAGVSPATLYIYYKNKNELILQIGIVESKRMAEATLKGFDPQMSFREGLKIQWENRARFVLHHPKENQLFEQLKNSSLREKFYQAVKDEFAGVMGPFLHKAVKNRELQELPIEVYWSMAFAPLYNLLRFHFEGRSMGDKPFRFSNKVMYQTLELVLKALHP